MDGIQKILARIEADARAACDEIAAASAARCAELQAEYAAREREAYGYALKQGAEEAAARYERLLNVAKLESKKQVLAEKQALVGETFAHAVSYLRSLPEKEYAALLARLAQESAAKGDETLVFSPEDRERVGASVTRLANAALKKLGKPASLTLSDETRAIDGGLIVSGGEIEVNCALDKLVALYRNELEPRVAEILFG
ncbi:MAG: V-type ATP synthase subunit E [Oscillospiraceae bacterium]|jgi:V/A-type H+-transporting ATPase subunit E|nr:V-type ATP synthase subunit E [Oscillospiraceae bacterium]